MFSSSHWAHIQYVNTTDILIKLLSFTYIFFLRIKCEILGNVTHLSLPVNHSYLGSGTWESFFLKRTANTGLNDMPATALCGATVTQQRKQGDPAASGEKNLTLTDSILATVHFWNSLLDFSERNRWRKNNFPGYLPFFPGFPGRMGPVNIWLWVGLSFKILKILVKEMPSTCIHMTL